MEKKTRSEICQAAVRKVFGGRRDLKIISQSLVESALDRVELKAGGSIESLTEHQLAFLAESAAWFVLENELHMPSKGETVSAVRQLIAEHVFDANRTQIECAAAKRELQTAD